MLRLLQRQVQNAIVSANLTQTPLSHLSEGITSEPIKNTKEDVYPSLGNIN